MKKLVLFTFAVLLFLSGCNDDKKFTPKSKKYYLENAQIAKDRSKECKQNGFTSEEEKIDCRNAILANDEITSKYNSPVIGDEKQVGSW